MAAFRPFLALPALTAVALSASQSVCAPTRPIAPARGTYTRIDFPGSDYTEVSGLNNRGQVVGNFADPKRKKHGLFGSHGFLWDHGVFTRIAFPRSDADTDVEGVNDKGQVVGWYITDSIGHRGFLWSAGVFAKIGPPHTTDDFTYAINNKGQIVGLCLNPNASRFPYWSGFLWKQGNYIMIEPPNIKGEAHGEAVNNAAEIAGDYQSVPGASKPWLGFLWRHGASTTIAFPKSFQTRIANMNDSGQIVGGYDADGLQHGFLCYQGVYTTIDPPDSKDNVYAKSINSQGQIAGYYEDHQDIFHGFLFSHGVFTRVDFPNTTDTTIVAINDHGQVAGYYDARDKSRHGFLFTPAR